MSFTREQLDFGRGSFVGTALNDPEFFDLPIREQAKVIGWAVGCPVVDELTDPEHPNPARGPESMLKRYGEVGFWFGYIAREIKDSNPELYQEFMSPMKRLNGEPVGKYEPQSVPEDYIHYIPPTETIAGYVLPRLLIKQIGTNSSNGQQHSRLVRGLSVLREAIPASETPAELVALLADGISKRDVHPLTVISTILPIDWNEEHNSGTAIEELKTALMEKAPDLWIFYSTIRDQEKFLHRIL